MISSEPERYLYDNAVRSGYSAAHAINEVCFSSTGYLRDEFRDLYRSLFDNSELHLTIIRTLAQRMAGITLDDLRERIGVSSGGRFSTAVKELQESNQLTMDDLFC